MNLYLHARNLRSARRMVGSGEISFDYIEAKPGDIIFKYGIPDYWWTYPKDVHVINGNVDVPDKYDHVVRFREAGVSTPRSWIEPTEWEALDKPFPAIIKRRINSHGGKDIRYVSESELQTSAPYNYYFQEFIPKVREFRTASFGNVLAYVMEKMPLSVEQICWNKAQGSSWVYPEDLPEYSDRLSDLCGRALEAIDYEFGGIDIILYEETFYILEVNSRPSLGPQNALKVIDGLKIYAGEKYGV